MLNKNIFKSKQVTCSLIKVQIYSKNNNISISGNSPNEKSSKTLSPNNDDKTNVLGKKSDGLAEDDDTLSSSKQSSMRKSNTSHSMLIPKSKHFFKTSFGTSFKRRN